MDTMSRLIVGRNIAPQDTNGATAGVWISLKNALRCTVMVTTGALNGALNMALRLRQAINVAGGGAKALNFTHIWRPCGVLRVTAPTGQFTVGETVTGAGGTTGIVHKFDGERLYLHTTTNVYVDGELLTGGTSAVTATANGTLVAGLKARVPLAAAADTYTFNSAAHANNTFEIDIDPASLDKAGNFDCIQMDVTAGTTASFVTINYLVVPKYPEEPTQNVYIN
jgi:hypothetical protein